MSFVLLALMWSNLGSGFWMLEATNLNIISLFNTIRALMPFVLTIILFPIFLSRTSMHSIYNPVTWLMIYGFISLFSSILSPYPYASFYFGSAFIMNLIVPYIFFSKRQLLIGNADQNLLISTWMIFLMIVIAIVFYIGSDLFTGYGIANLIDNASRSSGLARWFSVTALIIIPLLIHSNSKLALLYIVPILFCAYIVWILQSRGSAIAFVISLISISFIHKAKRKYLFFAVITIFIAIIILFADSIVSTIYEYLRRGQDTDSFMSLSGRTGAWLNAMETIQENLFLGYGHWADRLLIGEHVHNAPIQAAMNSGILGSLTYLISWTLGFYFIIKIRVRYIKLKTIDKILFLQASPIYIFFTFRSITETTFASFSADSLLIVPIMLFLFSLERRSRNTYHTFQINN